MIIYILPVTKYDCWEAEMVKTSTEECIILLSQSCLSEKMTEQKASWFAVQEANQVTGFPTDSQDYY